jgi:Arm DNA-binding domain
LLFEAFWCLFGPSKITLAHGLCCPKITFVAPKFVANETETVRVYLTVKAIQALKLAEPGGRYDVADAIVPGFGVRVNAKGKSYTLTARFPGSTHPTRRTIAAVGEIDLATARNKARTWLVKIRKGDKPPSVRVLRVVTPKAETFEQVVTKFLEQHVHRNSLRTAHEVERIIHKDLMPLWRTREFKSIRRGDVARRGEVDFIDCGNRPPCRMFAAGKARGQNVGLALGVDANAKARNDGVRYIIAAPRLCELHGINGFDGQIYTHGLVSSGDDPEPQKRILGQHDLRARVIFDGPNRHENHSKNKVLCGLQGTPSDTLNSGEI